MNSIDELHNHLSYIQKDYKYPETNVFVNAIFDKPSLVKKSNNLEFSIVLSDTYMFEETDIGQYLISKIGTQQNNIKDTPTLFLPKLEMFNPLYWSALVHEMCHAISKKEKNILTDEEINEITKGNNKSKHILYNWIEEIYCDLMSIHLLGPAYLCSFIDFIVAVGSQGYLERETATHPAPRFRIYLMLYVLKRNKNVIQFLSPLFGKWKNLHRFFNVLFESRNKIERNYFNPGYQEQDFFQINFDEFRKAIEDHVEHFIPFDKNLNTLKQEKLHQLYDRLKNKIPIRSYSPNDNEENNNNALDACEKINTIIKHNSNYDNKINEYLKTLYKRTKEAPCTIAEIINSGWLYKYEVIYQKAIEDISNINEEEFKYELFKLDELLKNSIETSYLHQLLMEGIVNNGK